MARPRPRALVLALVGVAIAAIVALAVMPNGLVPKTSSNSTAAAPTGQTAQEPEGEENEACEAGEGGEEAEDGERCELGYFDPRKEAKFERTVGEADRGGADNPAAEQVDNRAFPRAYVDDKRALKGRHAFDAKPKKLHRSDFKTARAYRAYQA